jgi:hypothetical protein
MASTRRVESEKPLADVPQVARADRLIDVEGAVGMDVVAVSERLGHWSPSLTLTVYAHAIRGRQRGLARAVGAILA